MVGTVQGWFYTSDFKNNSFLYPAIKGIFPAKLVSVLEQDGVLWESTPEELEAWYKAVDELKPKQIMIYVIDRKTPEEHLEKISPDEMEKIATPLRQKGYDVIVSA